MRPREVVQEQWSGDLWPVCHLCGAPIHRPSILFCVRYATRASWACESCAASLIEESSG